MEIQFNVVSRETLIAAKKAPWEYRDLLVRVSGFSAYFIDLDGVTQDEIIARVEHSTMSSATAEANQGCKDQTRAIASTNRRELRE
jgi:hypothetical protein